MSPEKITALKELRDLLNDDYFKVQKVTANHEARGEMDMAAAGLTTMLAINRMNKLVETLIA